jgi:hypothetical protein
VRDDIASLSAALSVVVERGKLTSNVAREVSGVASALEFHTLKMWIDGLAPPAPAPLIFRASRTGFQS